MSMPRPWRTALIGFGGIASGLARDRQMAAYFRYATHAQVLADHPTYDWNAVVDPSPDARAAATLRGDIAHVMADIAHLDAACAPEVAVLAMPPGGRLAALDALPHLRAVIVEKPLGNSLAEAEAFAARCRERNIVVQVNLWRRADETFGRLATGDRAALIGRPQAVSGIYGNGLMNNGTHLVDFIRMLCGEIVAVRALGPARPLDDAPLAGDCALAGALTLADGTNAVIQPVDFALYREIGLDIWGESGRLEIVHESLTARHYPRAENRGLDGACEIASDQPTILPRTVGEALYRLYDNLAAAMTGSAPLFSPLDNALADARLIDALRQSAACDGAAIRTAS